MRIALISDIHGNTVALDAVLAHVGRHAPDLIVCLGDIAAGGPDPGGAVDRIARLGCIAVKGNTDAGMVEVPDWWRDPGSTDLPADAVPGLKISAWCAEVLHETQRRYLADLPDTAGVDLGTAGDLLAFHGSPRSADDFLTPTTSREELGEMFAGASASILAGGHTHVPSIWRYGTSTIVNPGSVGLPFAEYGYAGAVTVPPHAAYGIVETDGGEVSIELRQVSVDRSAVEDSVARSEMPHADWWLGLSCQVSGS